MKEGEEIVAKMRKSWKNTTNLILLPFSGGKELVKFKIGKFFRDSHENSKKIMTKSSKSTK
ncbi:MAG: hypothetical protein EBZ47_05205 [Chlamydiae bacterium]|nr:hypothetical protein [Chlamydiota bacterium]